MSKYIYWYFLRDTSPIIGPTLLIIVPMIGEVSLEA